MHSGVWTDLIGKPFKYGGRGPDFFDCYGLVMEVSRRNGVELIDYTSPTNLQEVALLLENQKPLWTPVNAPVTGDAVAIRLGRYVCHVGILIGDNRLLHTWERSGGVTLEPLNLWRARIEGFYRYQA